MGDGRRSTWRRTTYWSVDRLARSTRDLLNPLAAISGKKAGFRSLGDPWADTTTSYGRLMPTVLGGLAEFERELIRARTYIRPVSAPRGAPVTSWSSMSHRRDWRRA